MSFPFSFSQRSLDKLASCDPRLIRICTALIKRYNFTVLCGYRGKEEQNDAFEKGNSKVQWPNSKHNASPARAVDLAPYPINWEDIGRFKVLALAFLEEAKKAGIEVRWGADWDRDGDWRDEKFRDWPHFELMEK